MRNGQLNYHRAYAGPRPITYVDTRLYQGGPDSYIEAFINEEVIWLRVIRDLLDAHHIPRRNILLKNSENDPARALRRNPMRFSRKRTANLNRWRVWLGIAILATTLWAAGSLGIERGQG